MEKRKILPFFGISRRIFAVEKFSRSPEMNVEKKGSFSAKTRKQFLWVLWVFAVWVLWKKQPDCSQRKHFRCRVSGNFAARKAGNFAARKAGNFAVRKADNFTAAKRQFSRPRIGREAMTIFGVTQFCVPCVVKSCVLS